MTVLFLLHSLINYLLIFTYHCTVYHLQCHEGQSDVAAIQNTTDYVAETKEI